MSPVRLLFAISLILYSAPGAFAGAWPRADGETFLSFSLDLDSEDINESYASLYVEHGIGRGFTLGLDVGNDSQGMSKGIGFMRWSISGADSAGQIAVELGAGVVEDELAVRPGLSLGRGLSLGKKSGWVSLESRVTISGDRFNTLLETDLTFGLNAGPRSKWMLQVQTGVPEASPAYVKLAPAIAFERKPGRHILLGVTAGVIEVDDIKFNLGIWHKF